MNTLANFALDRLIAASSEEQLIYFIEKAEKKLRDGTQYKIIQSISKRSIFKNAEMTHTLDEQIEEIEIILKFFIKLLETFEDPTRYLEGSWDDLEIRLIIYPQPIFDQNVIRQLSSHLDYLKYFLQKVYEHKNDSLEIKELIILLYKHSVFDPPFRKYGFSLRESLQVYEMLNEIINSTQNPEYFDPELLLNYHLAHLYDYIVCYHDKNNDFHSFVIEDTSNLEFNIPVLNERFKIRVYQVKF